MSFRPPSLVLALESSHARPYHSHKPDLGTSKKCGSSIDDITQYTLKVALKESDVTRKRLRYRPAV